MKRFTGKRRIRFVLFSFILAGLLACVCLPATLLGSVFSSSSLSTAEKDSQEGNVSSSVENVSTSMSSSHIFISSSGDDSNSGLSSSPVKTLSKALDLVASNSSINTIEFLNPITITTNTTLTNGAGKDVYFVPTSGFSGEGMILYGASDITLTLDGDDSSTSGVVERFIFDGERDSGKFGRAIYSNDTFSNISIEINNSTFQNFKINSFGGAIYFANTVTTTNITNSTFTENSANYSGGVFYFNEDVDSFSLDNVDFVNNSSSFSGGAIFFNNFVDNLQISNCSFDNNSSLVGSGGAIRLFSAGTFNINNSSFNGNYANEGSGGAIYIELKVDNFSSNNTNFLNNYALGGSGGAIYCLSAGSFRMTTSGSSFLYNNNVSGGIGGVLFIQNCAVDSGVANSGLYLSFENTQFNNNSAQGAGGVFYVDKTSSGASLNFAECEFNNNSAQGAGGALYIYSTNAIVNISNCDFVGNSAQGHGGAIYCSGASYFNFTTDGVETHYYNNNSANQNGDVYGYGGLMSIESCYRNGDNTGVNINITNAQINNNYAAGHAGVIRVVHSDNAIININEAEISENYARWYGGIICMLAMNAELNINNSIVNSNESRLLGNIYIEQYNVNVNLENTEFLNNSSGLGGVLYINNLVGYDSEISIENCKFYNNSSTGSYNIDTSFKLNGTLSGGGAIFSSESLNIVNCDFVGNTAQGPGGAIYCSGASYFNFTTDGVETHYYNDNSASGENASGGFLYVVNCASTSIDTGIILDISNVQFNNNSSTGSGGAIYIEDIISNFALENVTFNGNTTYFSGGAIYFDKEVSIVALENCQFNDNECAFGSGGAIRFMNVDSFTATNCTFNNNLAPLGLGGALLFNFEVDGFSVTDCQFNGNNSTGGGAINFFFTLSSFSATNCEFNNNISSESAGGGVFFSNSCVGTIIDLQNCDLNNNSAGGSGGALYMSIKSAVVTLHNCDFSGNSAVGSGGAIYSYRASSFTFTTDGVERHYYNGNNLDKVDGVQSFGGFLYVGYCLYNTDGTGVNINLDNVEINNNVIIDSGSSGYGGAIFVHYCSDFKIDFKDSVMNGNSNIYGPGGFLAVEGSKKDCVLLITDCQVNNNESTSIGGAIYLYSITSCDLDIVNCLFIENSSQQGGAIAYKNSNNFDINIENTLINGNTSNGHGGGIYFEYINSSNISIKNSQINQNSSTYYGGGIYVGLVNDTVFNIESCKIDYNSIEYHGAGIGIDISPTLELNILNSSINNNYAKFIGGAIRINSIERLFIENSEISGNTANLSGGIYINLNQTYSTQAKIIIKNTIFNDNVSNSQYTPTTETSDVVGNLSGGGAIFSTQSMTIENCYFIGNYAKGAGGAIRSYADSIKDEDFDLNIINSYFENNTSDDNGGAIYTTGTISLNNSYFTDNTSNATGLTNGGGGVYANHIEYNIGILENNSTSGTGGGIYANSGVLKNLTFRLNSTDNLGGGAFFNVADISDCLFENNSSSQNGGGLAIAQISGYNGITTRLINNEFTLNKAVVNGGGLYFGLDDENTPLDISNLSFSNNTAFDGGAIYSHSSLSLSNINVAGNSTVSSENNVGAIITIYKEDISNLTSKLEFEFNSGFFANNTSYGGGLLRILGSPQFMAEVSMQDIEIYGNVEKVEGVLQLGKNSNVRLSNLNFYSNIGVKGGAISVDSNSNINSQNLLFNRNFATYGSTLYMKTGSKFTLRDVIFSEMESEHGIVYTEYNSDLIIAGQYNIINDQRVSSTKVSDNVGVNGSFVYALGSVLLSGIDIYNNYSTQTGGIIYVSNGGQVRIYDCNIYNNFAGNLSTSGQMEITEQNLGGVGYIASQGAIMVDGKSKISSNQAYKGGAFYVAGSGALNMISSMVVESENIDENDTFVLKEVYGFITGNSAKQGGGVYIESNANASLVRGVINENVADLGAGIYNEGNLIISGGEIIENEISDSSTDKKGAGIYNYGTLIVNSGKISGNNAKNGYGGGVYSHKSSYQVFEKCEINSNLASNGAGLFIESGKIVNIYNSTINENILNSGATGELGVAVYMTDGDLLLKNVEVGSNGDGNGNIIYNSNGNINIDSCYIYSNNGSNIVSFVGNNTTSSINNSKMNKIEILNTIFGKDRLGNVKKNTGGYITDCDEVYLTDCEFYSNVGSILLNSRLAKISNCSFVDSVADGIIKIDGNKEVDVTFVNCSFSGNSNLTANQGCSGFGGAVNITNTNIESLFNFENATFTNNSATYGGAIYLNCAGTISLEGEVVFELNSANSGKAIYKDINCNLILRKGSLIKTEGDNEIASNGLLKILEGRLNEQSYINIQVQNARDGSVVLDSYQDNLPIFNDTILNCFNYVGTQFVLVMEIVSGGQSPDYKVSLKTADSSSFNVVVGDIVFSLQTPDLSGNSQMKNVISKNDFMVFGADDWTLEFLNNNGDWSTQSDEFNIVGDYEVEYRVTKIETGEIKTGTINVKVIDNILYLVDIPDVVFEYSSTGSYSKGTAIFKNGRVEDANGSVVAGSWAVSDNVTITNILDKYEIVFTPANSNVFSNPVTVLTRVDILYDKVFYQDGNFYADINNLNYKTGITKLSEMVNYIRDGGFISFNSTYFVQSDEVVVANKNISFVKYLNLTSEPMIKIADSGEGNLPYVFELYGGNGTISFEGKGSLTYDSSYNPNAFCPIIENYGKLVLNSNVIIRNYKIYHNVADGYPEIYSLIYNAQNAELILNGCQIYNNRVYSITDYDYGSDYRFGGIIYNQGNILINGGEFHSNFVSNQADIRDLWGGFINTTGQVIVNSGNIYLNNAEYGGAFYVGNGGTLTLNGGEIYGNLATTSGGAVYVDNGGTLVINGAKIYGNIANSTNAGIGYATSSDNPPVIIDGAGAHVSEEVLSEIESQNQIVVIKEKNNDLLNISIVLFLITFFVFAVEYRKNKKRKFLNVKF